MEASQSESSLASVPSNTLLTDDDNPNGQRQAVPTSLPLNKVKNQNTQSTQPGTPNHAVSLGVITPYPICYHACLFHGLLYVFIISVT